MKDENIELHVSKLYVFSLKSTDSFFESNVSSWLSSLVSLLKEFPPPNVQELCHAAIVNILRRYDGTNRESLVKIVDQLLQHIASNAHIVTSSSWQVIVSSFKHFRSLSAKHMKELENLAKYSIKSTNKSLRHSASYVFPKLSVCGPGGEKGLKHSQAWLSSLTRSIDAHFTVLLSVKSLLYGYDKNNTVVEGDKLGMSDVLNGVSNLPPVQQATALFNLLDSFLVILEGYFCETLPFLTQVPIMQLTQLFYSYKFFLDSSTTVVFVSKSHVSLLVNRLIERMLKSLHIFIQQFQSLLIPLTSVLSELLIQAINTDIFKSKSLAYSCSSDILRVMPRNKTTDEFVEVICSKLRYMYECHCNESLKLEQWRDVDSELSDEFELEELCSAMFSDFYLELDLLLNLTISCFKYHASTMNIDSLEEICRISVQFLKLYVVDKFNVKMKHRSFIQKLFQLVFHIVRLNRIDFVIDTSIFIHFIKAGLQSEDAHVACQCRDFLQEHTVLCMRPNKTFCYKTPILLESTYHLSSQKKSQDTQTDWIPSSTKQTTRITIPENSAPLKRVRPAQEILEYPLAKKKLYNNTVESPHGDCEVVESDNVESLVEGDDVTFSEGDDVTNTVVLSSDDEVSCNSPKPSSRFPTAVNVSDDEDRSTIPSKQLDDNLINSQRQSTSTVTTDDLDAILETFVNVPADE